MQLEIAFVNKKLMIDDSCEPNLSGMTISGGIWFDIEFRVIIWNKMEKS
jgi:hypothetical protein